MCNNKIIELKKPEENSHDPLTDHLRRGACQLIAEAVESELQELLKEYSDFRNETGHKQIVRNRYLPAREIHTGIGPVKVKAPKVRDKSGQRIKFNSTLLPPYLRKRGLSKRPCHGFTCTGDFKEALHVLFGKDAKDL